jgi:hypothetical protein
LFTAIDLELPPPVVDDHPQTQAQQQQQKQPPSTTSTTTSLRLEATDADSGDNGRLTYSILPEDHGYRTGENRPFTATINGQTGELSLAPNVLFGGQRQTTTKPETDAEREMVGFVRVKAEDAGQPDRRHAIATVRVHVVARRRPPAGAVAGDDHKVLTNSPCPIFFRILYLCNIKLILIMFYIY